VNDWNVTAEQGSARAFHLDDSFSAGDRQVRIFTVQDSALVLGSTQSVDDVDTAVAQHLMIDVFRRRSGGGAVLLQPNAQLWCDVFITKADQLWSEDVGVASHWLGDVWAEALGSQGFDDAVVHRGPMQVTVSSSVLCFAGLGPGEVTIDGAKCVGISQRRTREGARFQCSVPAVWNSELHEQLLGPGLQRVGGDLSALRAHPVTDSAGLLAAFEAALP